MMLSCNDRFICAGQLRFEAAHLRLGPHITLRDIARSGRIRSNLNQEVEDEGRN